MTGNSSSGKSWTVKWDLTQPMYNLNVHRFEEWANSFQVEGQVCDIAANDSMVYVVTFGRAIPEIRHTRTRKLTVYGIKQQEGNCTMVQVGFVWLDRMGDRKHEIGELKIVSTSLLKTALPIYEENTRSFRVIYPK